MKHIFFPVLFVFLGFVINFEIEAQASQTERNTNIEIVPKLEKPENTRKLE